ncbi:hypothetical protein A3K79_04295 [Candidatus Bathyarchaeota archaeon RBG_13_46_16b]|nr:MAG: hypothetical protein A3K79_04295 [Candidatus Bathyarchaeota archaeon RBG_13_46_16b]
MKGEGSVMSRKPSCVKASGETVVFTSSLKDGSYLWKILNSGLDVLKENMFAGQRVEKRKLPRY